MNFKKPKFWDLKKKTIISYLLLPFTIPIIINNHFLNKKLKKIPQKIKSLCVGNIYLGGTGKTPTVVELYKILNDLNLKISTGKKFYPSHSDERSILKKNTRFVSGNNRNEILEIAKKNDQDLIIFDDGLQDKNISYDLQFVCFDSERWIGNGNLIPSGPLREKISSLKKYDAVFLKHHDEQYNFILDTIKNINSDLKIFFTKYTIKNIHKFDLSQNYLIFSGIGNPHDFKKTLLNYNFKIIDEIIFPDHFNYEKKDINKIKKQAEKINAKIITTEKDYVKISKINDIDLNYIEIDLEILNKTKLIDFLKSRIL